MRLRAALICVLSIFVLVGCAGGPEGEEPVAPPPPGTAATTHQSSPGPASPSEVAEPEASSAASDAEEGGLDDILGGTNLPLAVGDCFGLEDEIQLDPIPCSGPHIFEVVGIVLDWPYEDYEGSFEAGVAGDEAMRQACKSQATAYFGYDPVDAGIMVDHNQPQFWGHEDKVVCSAHSGPDVETVRDEVVGSFEDRGW